MPLARATIGSANAGAGPALEPMAFPVDPGGTREKPALESLLQRARERGVVGARLFGHVATPPPHAAEAVHAGAGLVALAAAACGLEAGLWALVGVILSGVLRAAGLPSLGGLLPGRPSWTLFLRPCGPRTRRLVVSATDRARSAPRLPLFVLGALALALLSLAGPTPARLLGAGALAAVGVVAGWLGRAARAEVDGPETTAARALLRFAEQSSDPTIAVALVGCSSAQGAGIAAVLDWWGLRKEDVAIDILTPRTAAGGLDAPVVAALTRAGWKARSLPPDELRSSP